MIPESNRLPPHDSDTERGVLGAIFLDPEESLPIAEEFGLEAIDFYELRHSTIWKAIRKIGEQGNPIDVITVKQSMSEAELEKSGGLQYLAKLSDSIPSTAMLPSYLDHLRKQSILRRIIRFGSAVAAASYDNPDDIDDVIDDLEVSALAVRRLKEAGSVMSAGQVVKALKTHIFAGGKPAGVMSGLPDLDSITRGWQNGEMIVIAARPGLGKTSLGIQMAIRAASDGVPTLFFSQEMTAESLGYRILACESRLRMRNLIEGADKTLNSSDLDRLKSVCDDLEKLPLFIDDEPRLTPSTIRARARRMRKTQGIGLIIVDYLQLLHVAGRQENRQTEIATISGLMKALAMELGVPVIVLSQLNRKVEDRGGRPKLSDLRESGAIEQDSDVVCLLFQNKEDEEEAYDGRDLYKINLLVAKNRNGQTGNIETMFHSSITRFESITKKETDQETYSPPYADE